MIHLRTIPSLAALILLAVCPSRVGAQTAQTKGIVTVLHSFTGSVTDGEYPTAPPLQAADGNFYGTGERGGSGESGVVYRLTPAGAVTVVYSFKGTGRDGSVPLGPLTRAASGNFFGTTIFGGGGTGYGGGTVFRVTPAGKHTTVHSFADAPPVVGLPLTGVVNGGDGYFYGVTYGASGGADATTGTFFRVDSAGRFTSVYNFPGNSRNDHYPTSLIRGRDGNFYGTTIGVDSGSGQPPGGGTVFKITRAGVVTTLHEFTGTDGTNPDAALVEGRDGYFYGVTSAGGTHGNGTVFRFVPGGAVQTLHSFGALDDNSRNADGAIPNGALVEGPDGYFYGTTDGGGADAEGVVFQITPAGRFTPLHSFAPGAKDGQGPNGLVLGQDGDFYGTSFYGGTDNGGTFYRLTLTPFVTGARNAAGTVGKAFSYQIAAGYQPTSYAVKGLPGAFKLDAKTGLITGTPTAPGKTTVTLEATNAAGTGTAPLTLTIYAGPPVVTSPRSAAGTVGKPFSYRITATNDPASFGVLGLPPGLHVDAKTGLISGTPTTPGTKSLTLKATNAAGIGQAMLTLTVSQ